MSKKELIILKILGIGITVVYGWSFLWISLLYIYGGLFYPFGELGMRNGIYFNIFVIILSLSIIGLIFFKLKGKTFYKILIQDIGLIIVSLPFFGLITGYFENGFDEPEKIPFVYGLIFILTVLTINANDWVKTKKPVANSSL